MMTLDATPCAVSDEEPHIRHHAPWFSPRVCGPLSRLCRRPGLALIRFYQTVLAKEIHSRHCRFNPTCSHYAYEAIARHGLIFGALLAYKRISRCNPSHPGGNDPVP